MEPITLIILILWYLVGVGGTIYLWTDELDLDIGGLFTCLILGGLMGPFSLIIILFSKLDDNNKVFIKKRN